MPKFSRFRYSQDYYGATSALIDYSVEPFDAFVHDYTKESGRVELTWTPPSGDFSQMRIVRNQDAFPETAEDGVIIFDKLITPTSPLLENAVDDVTTSSTYAPFVPGRYAYYRAWLRKTNDSWYPAGDAYTLVPLLHSTRTSRNTTRTAIETHTEGSEGISERLEYSNLDLLTTQDKMMDLLPRVYTSASQSPLDEVDRDSDLYRFMGAFAATYDESLTFTDLLKPQHNGRSANPTTLELAANQLGLTPEPTFATKTQKRMIREARYLYSHKGTPAALGTLAESVTGYAPRISESVNILPTNQDSTFNGSTGFWKTSGGSTITAKKLQDVSLPPVAAEISAIDLDWAAECSFGSGSAGYISLGEDSVFTRAIPVDADTSYAFSLYAITSSGTATVKMSITWYNNLGVSISTTTATSGTVSSTWSKLTTGAQTSPSNATYASVRFWKDGSASAQFYVDLVQFSPSTITNYEEARGVNVYLAPSKVNYLKNPSFELLGSISGFNAWTINCSSNQVASTLNLIYGETYMAEVITPTGALHIESTTDAGVTPINNFYTFSFYGKVYSGTQALSIGITASDGSVSLSNTSSVTLSSTWDRYSVTIKVPEAINPNDITLKVSIDGTTAGVKLYLDNAQLESSYSASDYFDGSTGYLHGATWAGTPHASISYLYPNKMEKMPRLISEIPKYVAINTPFIIQTANGIEYKSIT